MLGEHFFVCALRDRTFCLLPIWMTDALTCSRLRFRREPMADVAAFVALADLIEMLDRKEVEQ